MWPSLYQFSKKNNDQKKGCFLWEIVPFLVVSSCQKWLQALQWHREFFLLFYRTGCFLYLFTGQFVFVTFLQDRVFFYFFTGQGVFFPFLQDKVFFYFFTGQVFSFFYRTGCFFPFFRTGSFLTGSQKLDSVCCGSNSLVPQVNQFHSPIIERNNNFFVLYFGIVYSKILNLEYVFHACVLFSKENAKLWPFWPVWVILPHIYALYGVLLQV